MAKYLDQSAAIAQLTRLEVTSPNATMTDAKRALADMFPADAAPVVRSSWNLHTTSGGHEYTVCAHCSTSFSCRLCDKGSFSRIDMRGAHYCPNCGAKMDGVL